VGGVNALSGRAVPPDITDTVAKEEMMFQRSRAIAALLPLLILAGACDDNDDDVTGIGNNNTATVRFINATNTNIDVSNGGTVGTGNSNLGFGVSSSCMTVNTSGTDLQFRTAGTTTAISGFTPNFTTGGNYTVIAYPGTGTTGTQFVTFNNAGFTPNTGQAGLRIVNAASGTGSLVALGNGTAMGGGTGVPFGTAGSFMSVNAGTQAVTFNTGTGTSTVANAGNLTFTAGQNYTLVVAPATTGSAALRTFLVTGC
jgi:hypothetical protein